MSDQEQVVDRASIGDDHLHRSEAQSFETIDFAVKTFNSVVDPDVVGFEESVEFVTSSEPTSTGLLHSQENVGWRHDSGYHRLKRLIAGAHARDDDVQLKQTCLDNPGEGHSGLNSAYGDDRKY
jgi:hypothetical protein